jgi:membrane protease YdiL (CAAX protease family)
VRNSQVRSNILSSTSVMAVAILASFFAISLAEAVLAWGGILVSGSIHALILLGYLNAFAFLNNYPYRNVFLLLALIPLLRLVSLTVLLPILPPIYWYLLAGAPVLLVIALISRVVPLNGERLRIHKHQLIGELAVALTGFPVSLSAYLVMRPKALTANLDWAFLLVGGLILLLFSGFLEELIFRALLPEALQRVFGSAEVIISMLLYTCLFISSQSGLYIALAGSIGLLYNLWVRHSGTIWGVVVSHTLWLIGMILVWPVVLHL